MEASSGVEPLSVSLEGTGPHSHGEAESGAGERSRTVPCLVGNDAAHHARPRNMVASSGIEPHVFELSARRSRH